MYSTLYKIGMLGIIITTFANWFKFKTDFAFLQGAGRVQFSAGLFLSTQFLYFIASCLIKYCTDITAIKQ